MTGTGVAAGTMRSWLALRFFAAQRFARMRSARRACRSSFRTAGRTSRNRDRCRRARREARGLSRQSPPVRHPSGSLSNPAHRLRREVSPASEDGVRRVGGSSGDRVFCRARRSTPRRLPLATIRLTGQIPPGARHFTWTYAWTFASYAMTVRSDRVREPRNRMAGRRPEQRAVRIGVAGAAGRVDSAPPGAISRSALPTSCRTDWITCCSCSAFTC